MRRCSSTAEQVRFPSASASRRMRPCLAQGRLPASRGSAALSGEFDSRPPRRSLRIQYQMTAFRIVAVTRPAPSLGVGSAAPDASFDGYTRWATHKRPITVSAHLIQGMSDPSSQIDLAALMAQIASGDVEAFSDLYDEISGLVYGLALRVARSRAMAEEITQEVFIQVWERADTFDPERGSVKAWISTMTHRRAVDAVRRTQSARDREDKVLPDRPFDGVEESVIAQDERDRIRDALSALTDLQFEAIEMAYYQGLTYVEVANHLDSPLGTVKSRMRDGLHKLRAMMGEDDG